MAIIPEPQRTYYQMAHELRTLPPKMEQLRAEAAQAESKTAFWQSVLEEKTALARKTTIAQYWVDLEHVEETLADLELIEVEVSGSEWKQFFVLLYWQECIQQELALLQAPGSDQPANPLPPELATEEAMKYWRRLQEWKLVDENYQPTCSYTQAAIIAFLFAAKLDIQPKWKVFGTFWGKKNMAGTYQEALKVNRSKEVSRLLNSEVFQD